MKSKPLIIAAVAIAALAAGSWLSFRPDPEPAAPRVASVLPAPVDIPAFSLTDQLGNPVDQSVFAGQWDLVFFGFTHCPDICPMTLQVLSLAQQQLEAAGTATIPRIVLVTVDPERDTVEVLQQYVAHFGDSHVGLTGAVEQIEALTSGLGIYFKKGKTDGDGYNVDHSAVVLVINPEGQFHALFSAPHVPDNFVHDLPLIMERS